MLKQGQLLAFIEGQDRRFLEAIQQGDMPVIEDYVEFDSNYKQKVNEVYFYEGKSGASLAPPLIICIEAGHKELMAYLLEHHADPNVCDGKGMTPIMLAANQQELETVKTLREHKASVSVVDDEGHSVLEYARGHAVIHYLAREKIVDMGFSHLVRKERPKKPLNEGKTR